MLACPNANVRCQEALHSYACVGELHILINSTGLLARRAQRTVLVPAELGYGNKGVGEIPPGASFEMRVEVLNVG